MQLRFEIHQFYHPRGHLRGAPGQLSVPSSFNFACSFILCVIVIGYCIVLLHTHIYRKFLFLLSALRICVFMQCAASAILQCSEIHLSARKQNPTNGIFGIITLFPLLITNRIARGKMVVNCCESKWKLPARPYAHRLKRKWSPRHCSLRSPIPKIRT